MAFINKKEIIIGKIINKRKRSFTRFAVAHNARIVFDSLAKARFLEHFNIVHRALFNTLCLKEFAFFLKISNTLNHFVIYFLKRLVEFFTADNIV